MHKETITKKKITTMLQGKLGFSISLCEEITDNFFSEILDMTFDDNKLILPNFGKLQIYQKGKRFGVNLQNGSLMEINPRKVLRFTPSKSFKEKVNSYESDL